MDPAPFMASDTDCGIPGFAPIENNLPDLEPPTEPIKGMTYAP
jgi:hypothetical protein